MLVLYIHGMVNVTVPCWSCEDTGDCGKTPDVEDGTTKEVTYNKIGCSNGCWVIL